MGWSDVETTSLLGIGGFLGRIKETMNDGKSIDNEISSQRSMIGIGSYSRSRRDFWQLHPSTRGCCFCSLRITVARASTCCAKVVSKICLVDGNGGGKATCSGTWLDGSSQHERPSIGWW